MNSRRVRFRAGALDALSAYPYPGNVRELENILERALHLLSGKRHRRGRYRSPRAIFSARERGGGLAVSCGNIAPPARRRSVSLARRTSANESALARNGGNRTRAAADSESADNHHQQNSAFGLE
jgi:transcriptional regulator with GAF, ATPase, and Fis domain